jgi:hypothetical protein
VRAHTHDLLQLYSDAPTSLDRDTNTRGLLHHHTRTCNSCNSNTCNPWCNGWLFHR